MDKILVTGADGQLGRCLRDIASFYTDFSFIFTDVAELDITSREAVMSYINELHPSWIVNAAAYTAVDKAESDVETARLLNATAVSYLVDVAKSAGAGLVHISTDYVFHGDNPEPLTEQSPCDPLSVYGRTKLEGEKAALSYDRSIVLRTGWLYSEYGRNFVKTILSLSSNHDSIRVVADQWGTPTSAHDLSKAIMTVIQNPVYGLFHFSDEGLTCWALFAEEIISKSGCKCTVEHISTPEYPLPAKRPQYSILSKKKFVSTFNVDIPEWEISLDDVLHKLKI